MRALPILLPLILTAPALSQSFTETFDAGSNEGSWSYGPPGIVIEPVGGNPDAWLHENLVDTFAPQARTTAASAAFHGDYRARQVTEIHSDFITVSTQFGFQREATLMLTDFNGTPGVGDDNIVYKLGSDFIPQVAEGWKSFSWAVPSQSATIPAGWLALQGAGTPDQVWNAAITNVDEVRFFYGDPTFFFIFDQWNVGLDNVGISAGPPIVSTYCTAKANSLGCNPNSVSVGTPSATDPNPFLVGAVEVLNNKNGLMFYGFAAAAIPFQNGTLCVMPPLQRTGVQMSGGDPPPSDCSGAYSFDFNALIQGGAPGLSVGADVFCQHWMRDPTVDATGVALSNGLRFTIQP